MHATPQPLLWPQIAQTTIMVALHRAGRLGTRYPGGVALRFARVVRYRDDKPVDEIDTIETVRSYLAGGRT